MRDTTHTPDCECSACTLDRDIIGPIRRELDEYADTALARFRAQQRQKLAEHAPDPRFST